MTFDYKYRLTVKNIKYDNFMQCVCFHFSNENKQKIIGGNIYYPSHNIQVINNNFDS